MHIWSYDDHTELFGREDLVRHFDLKRVSRNPAMFDQEKLDWLNGHYIREADTDRLAGLLGERLASLGVDTDPSVVRDGASLVQERSRTANEAAGMLRFLFEESGAERQEERAPSEVWLPSRGPPTGAAAGRRVRGCQARPAPS